MTRESAGVRMVRVFPDCGHERPLWAPGTAAYAIAPADLRLSPALTDRIAAWHGLWLDHFDIEASAWDSEDIATTYISMATPIVAAIRAEVGPSVTVADEVSIPS